MVAATSPTVIPNSAIRVSSTAGVQTHSPPETTKIPTALTVPFPFADETPITVAPSGVVYGSLKTCTLARFDRTCSSALRISTTPTVTVLVCRTDDTAHTFGAIPNSIASTPARNTASISSGSVAESAPEESKSAARCGYSPLSIMVAIC